MKPNVWLLLALAFNGCSGDGTDTDGGSEAGAADADPSGSSEITVDPAASVAALAETFNNVFVHDNLFSAGRPKSAESFAAVKAAGVKTVIDILPDAEHAKEFDEAKVIEELGMRYVHIPVTPKTLSADDVAAFGEALTSTDGNVFLHCGSANRAGGLYAAWLVSQGKDFDGAMELGKTVGLRSPSVIEAVRRVTGN